MVLKTGDIFTYERTFSKEDILKFAEFTGDKGEHHMVEDVNGKLMVHGLLTASLGTKIGGDLNFIGRVMDSEFLRPVFSGDTVSCEVRVTDVLPMDGFKKVFLHSIYRNQFGKEVLIGKSHGIIRDEVN